jgi:hypothetical protein
MDDHPITPAPEATSALDGTGYMEEAAVQDSLLDGKLAAIRQQEDAGDIATREAADKRVTAMEHHLDATRALRIARFGTDGGPE